MQFYSSLYALIPFLLGLVGALAALVYTPNKTTTSALQHFVAGIIIGAVATELVPKILVPHTPVAVIIGFIIGVGFMVTLHELSHLFAAKKGVSLPLRMAGAIALDLFVDGIIIGAAFIASPASGILVSISLSPCAALLAHALVNEIKSRSSSFSHVLLITTCVLLALPLGAFFANNLLIHLRDSFLIEILAAAVAALLYLGIEEFIVESHKNKQSHFTCLTFFAGFLLILTLQL